MTNRALRLTTRDYDYLTPLAYGDVVAEGLDIKLDPRLGGFMLTGNPSYEAGEISLSQYLIRTSQGEREYVGLPAFVARGFRHRIFIVLRGSNIQSFKDLDGKRVGTAGWIDTGNVWARAALREQGVQIDGIDWWEGPIDDPSDESHFVLRPQVAQRSNLHRVPAGRTIRDMLLSGELDALMSPVPPNGFYERGSLMVRLAPDYRKVEQDYARRVGFFPAHHIIALRREPFEREPWIASSLFRALDQSKKQWQAKRRQMDDASPWVGADFEDMDECVGKAWAAYGIEPNRKMIEAMCEEMLAQGLVDRPIDPASVFADFEKVMGH